LSTRRARSRRLASAATTAAPSPNEPPPARLLDLPRELLERVLSRCDSPIDIARVAAVSLLFHASLAEEGIRLWARERGFELPAQSEGEGCAVRWLCLTALLRESNPPARAAGGSRHSLFIVGEGRLSSCGTAALVHDPSPLGHGEGVTRLNTPTRIPSTLGDEGAVSVSAGAGHNLAITADGAVELGLWRPVGPRQSAGPVAADEGRRLGWPACRRCLGWSVCHSLALTADGAVFAWGHGGDGRGGHGDEQNQLLPKKVEAFAGRRVVAVSAGAHDSFAITADGAVWSWGSGEPLASWATATSRSSCCRRRSRPWLAITPRR